MAAKELDLGNVTGPVGPQGAVGPRGPQGIQGVPGKDATVNGYNTVTLAAAGNVELTQSGGEMTVKTTPELDEAVAVSKWQCNPNLLDNWYFANPVNQRGKTEYTGIVYGIDRWAGAVSSSKVAVLDGGIVEVSNFIMQFVDPAVFIAGAVYTFSLLLREDVAPSKPLMSIYYMTADTWHEAVSGNIPTGGDSLYVCRFTAPAGISRIRVAFSGPSANENKLRPLAVKLELGPVQTLAHKEGETWVLNEAPDYGTELRKCRWYYRKYPLPIVGVAYYPKAVVFPSVDMSSMRIRPTPKWTSLARPATVVNDEITVNGMTGNLVLMLKDTSTTNGEGFYLSGLELDANL